MRNFTSILFFALILCFILSPLGLDANNVDVAGSVIDKYKPTDITNFIQSPVTPLAKEVRDDFWLTSILILPFLVLPQVLLLICIFKFRKTNDGREPATFHENLPLEIIWTLVPALVLILMAVPTYKVIRDFDTPPPADIILNVTGKQFFWTYDYPERGLIVTSDTSPLVIPVGQTVVANLTSADVNHAWWVPAFGVKMDAVAGRTNQIWFNVEKTGWYEGQCAEICGAGHAQMWIDVVVVTEEEYEQWLVEKGAKNPNDSEDAAIATIMPETILDQVTDPATVSSTSQNIIAAQTTK